MLSSELFLLGSCGMSNPKDGSGVIFSPNFPKLYLPNLDCRWEIGGENGVEVRINISYAHLEKFYDSLQVYDGCCENHLGMIGNITGMGLLWVAVYIILVPVDSDFTRPCSCHEYSSLHKVVTFL